MNRREILSLTGATIFGATAIGTVNTADGATASEPSVTFTDQTTNGASITVDSITTNVDAQFIIRDSNANSIAVDGFDAGESIEDYTTDIRPPLSETETVSANLYNADGENIARESATIRVEDPVEYVSGMDPTLVEAASASGFNYPYYLYAPPRIVDEQPDSILVQPNNSGKTTDDFEVHKHSAKHRIEGGTSRSIADRLAVPLLIPVFPRPYSDPVDWRHYVHALDRQTMQISGGPLERVDLQLLRMVDHAKQKLSEQSYPVDDKIMLNGFSAAGNFVDRFTLLHPERVRSVTAGGLNGTAMLPIKEADDQTLNYPVGISDIEELTGEQVDLEALSNTNQFLYMGSEDTNDTIPYEDAWSEEMRELALDVYGEHMIANRFPVCQRAYEQADVESQFHVYVGAGHTPRPAVNDMVEFHQRSLNGESVSKFGEDVQGHATFDYISSSVETGTEVTFNASNSTTVPGSEILGITWDFDNGETAAGTQVEQAFTEAGDYNVTVEMITDEGITRTATDQVTVEQTEPSPDQGCDIPGDDGIIDIDDIQRAIRIWGQGGQC